MQTAYLHPDKHAALKRIIQRNRRPKPQPSDPRSMVERIAQQMALERQQASMNQQRQQSSLATDQQRAQQQLMYQQALAARQAMGGQ